MAKANWTEYPATEKTLFFKFKEGKSRLRILTQPMKFNQIWPNGDCTEETVVMAINVEDNNAEPQIVSIKKGMYKFLGEWAAENEMTPESAGAPYFLITRSGTDKSTKYTIAPGKTSPIPSYIDMKKVDQTLSNYVAKKEAEYNAQFPQPLTEDSI